MAAELWAHLGECAACAAEWRRYGQGLDALSALPPVCAPEPIAAAVFTRLEVETRGPGLALLFRSFRAERPLLLPSVLGAALLLLAGFLAGYLVLEPGPLPSVHARSRWPGPPDAPGTEANPLVALGEVSSPRQRALRQLPPEVLAAMEDGSLFFETVVARDGTVAAVTLIGGDADQARPIERALRRVRFEPGRFHGRAVAVSVYRLISRLEVRSAGKAAVEEVSP